LAGRGGEPIVDPSLFRSRSYVGALVISVSLYASFGNFMFAMTLLLQSGLGLSPLGAGLMFGPFGLAFALSSMAARPLTDRYGWRVIAGGAAASTLGLLVLLATLLAAGSGLTALVVMPGMVLIGIGNGFALPSLVGSALSGIPGRRAGAAAGLLTTTQQFASAIGVSVLGSVFFAVLGTHPGRGTYVSGMALLAGVDVVFILIALLSTRLLRPAPARARHAAKRGVAPHAEAYEFADS
jgi:MFS family permease